MANATQGRFKWSDDRAHALKGDQHRWQLLQLPFVLKAVVEQNVEVIFSDVSSVWLRDPFPFFAPRFDILLMDDASHLQQQNATSHGRGQSLEQRLAEKDSRAVTADDIGGLSLHLFVVRPTAPSLEFIVEWILYVFSRGIAAWETEKPLMNHAVARLQLRQKLPHIGVLPLSVFPPPWLLLSKNHLKESAAIACGVHKGSDRDKEADFRRLGLWMAGEKGT
eukprot:TRINITY_DN7582_c0_g3_i2.p1 TRINITY_DN7582_c0_g3~~TRINITY_DN7582_c0_g3_i2.p1  ORF type:complete len:258 (+),score=80.80 TRINITY_DN7582_c0_g3_i2:109-774(+)